MASLQDLQQAANEAYEAIHRNTGQKFPHATLQEAYDSFNVIGKSRGVAWLIDAAKGTGMSHMGLLYWLETVQKHLKLQDQTSEG